MTKIENGATSCPILLVFTVEYRILYTKGNWIEGKNVIRFYYIFFGLTGYRRNNSFELFTRCKIHVNHTFIAVLFTDLIRGKHGIFNSVKKAKAINKQLTN